MERPSNHDRNRSESGQQLRAEIIEKLPETPDVPSRRGIEVIGAMMGACVKAHREHGQLTREDAQAIAHFLALAVDDGDTLRRFADGTEVEMNDLRAEYLELAQRPNLYPETRAIIDWLGNYVLTACYPELEPSRPNRQDGEWQHPIIFKEDFGLTVAFHARNSSSVVEDEALMSRIERFALDHGTAGLAFLRLPTTDAAAPDLDEQFARSYVKKFLTVDGLISHKIIDIMGGPEHARHIHVERITGDVLEELIERAGRDFIAVELAGEIHTFTRDKPLPQQKGDHV